MAKNPFVDGKVNIAIPDSPAVYLVGAKIPGSLFGIEAIIEEDVNLNRAEIGARMLSTFNEGELIPTETEKIDFTGMQVGRDLTFNNGVIWGDVLFNGIKVRGNLDFNSIYWSNIFSEEEERALQYKHESRETGIMKVYCKLYNNDSSCLPWRNDLSLRGALIGGNVNLMHLGYFEMEGVITLDETKIGGNLNLERSRWHSLSMNKSQVAGNIDYRNDEQTLTGTIDIKESEIGGSLYFEGKDPNGTFGFSALDLTGTQIHKDLNLKSIDWDNAELYLKDSKIQGNADLRRSFFELHSIEGLNVDGHLYLEDAEITGSPQSYQGVKIASYSLNDKTQIPDDFRKYLKQFPQVERKE